MNQVLCGVFWSVLGVLATLGAMYLASRVGWVQIRWMREAHTLNKLKATPKIGTYIRIAERFDNGANFPPSYYVITYIHNEGELPARKLKGYWNLFSPDQSVKAFKTPIEREFLASAPLELEPHRLEGTTVWAAMKGEGKIRFNVDIDFVYFGFSENQQEHYNAQYHFDPQSKRVIRID